MTIKRVKPALLGLINGFIVLALFLQGYAYSQANDPLQDNFLAALRMMGEENYTEAKSQFHQLINEAPELSSAFRKLVETYIYLDDLEAGNQYFKGLLQKNINKPAVLYSLARIDFARKNYDAAIQKLKNVIRLEPKFVDAYSYKGGLPDVYYVKNDLKGGLRFFTELIKLNPEDALAHYGFARLHIKEHNWDIALKNLFKSIELDPNLSIAYHSIIYIYFSTSAYKQIYSYSKMLQTIAGKVNDYEMICYSTMMIGITYFFKGDYLNALFHFNEALIKAKKFGDRRREADCINNIASVYAMSGNYGKSIEYFKKTLLLSEKTGNKLSTTRTLANIGSVYKDQSNYDEALNFYQRALDASKINKLKYLESLTLTSIAEVYQQKKLFQKAIKFQNYALEIAKEIGEKSQEGYIIKGLGNLHMDMGKFAEASKFLRMALAIGKTLQDVQIIWESQAGLGACYAKQENIQDAVTHYANAISIYDSVRTNLNIKSLGNNFLEDKYEAYPSIVGLLAQNGKYHEAFTYVNKYKAKALLDVLFQGQNFLNELLSEPIRNELNEITYNLESIHLELSQEFGMSNKDSDKILSMDQKITDLELRRAVIIENLKKQNPQYYQLTSQDILELDDVQNRILEKNQALLQYIVGPQELSLFLVTSDTLIYEQVEVSRDSIHTLLANLSPIFDIQIGNEDKIRPQILNAQITDFRITPANHLFKVLIQPIEPWIQTTKELILVPDDILFYLPFEMLVSDQKDAVTEYDFDNATFLLENYEISYVTTVNQADQNMYKKRNPSKGILAFGNPDFGEDLETDQLMTFVSSETSEDQTILRGDKLANLPNSEGEVKAIGKAFGGNSNRILVGNEATEENLKNQAAEFSILHLATHFLINDDQPLYSKIVLAQRDKSKEDGYLQTYEVFNMNLNADLVVLSACNTGLGKIRKGEGVIGISRAFLYAGVPSLLASLWSVDDQSTATIMKSFYNYIQEGSTKRQALRLAKLDYLKSATGVKKDPFYWAPFILIGDWNPVDLDHRPALPTGMIIFASLLIVAILGWTVFKGKRQV